MTLIEEGYEWLADMTFNDYSQVGEDGVLQAIFSIIGADNEWCCEVGAADGLFFSNTRRWIELGWRAVLIEGDRTIFRRLAENNAGYGERVRCLNVMISQDCRIETILHGCGVPTDMDLMVIDVDGQDYYLWNSMLNYRPRVVVIEYDQAADEDTCPAIGRDGQAGELTIRRLGAGKYYTAVYRNRHNLIFVAQPLDRLLKGTREQMLR